MRNRIYLDVTILRHTGDARGIGQVTRQLIRLFAATPDFRDVQFISSSQVEDGVLAGLGVGKDRILRVPSLPLLSRFERYHGLLCDLRYLRIRRDATLIIHPECRSVLWSRIPQAVMLLDFLSFGRDSAGARKWDREIFFRYKYAKAASVATHFFAISEHTRREALRLYPRLDPGRVVSLHLGIRKALEAGVADAPPPDFSRVRFLYVGSFEARKNIPALIRRFAEVRQGRACRFDLAGRISDSEKQEIESLRSRLPHPEEIVLHGMVDDETLSRLYREAHFLLFPSLGEGFGLPVVEAMRNGLVVCAFRNTSIPELGDGNLLLAPDNDFSAWGAMIERLVDNPAAYSALAEGSRRRAEHFSEERMFERYAAYFRDLIGTAAIPGGSKVAAHG